MSCPLTCEYTKDFNSVFFVDKNLKAQLFPFFMILNLRFTITEGAVSEMDVNNLHFKLSSFYTSQIRYPQGNYFLSGTFSFSLLA
jgi:hypothetical protein